MALHETIPRVRDYRWRVKSHSTLDFILSVLQQEINSEKQATHSPWSMAEVWPSAIPCVPSSGWDPASAAGISHRADFGKVRSKRPSPSAIYTSEPRAYFVNRRSIPNLCMPKEPFSLASSKHNRKFPPIPPGDTPCVTFVTATYKFVPSNPLNSTNLIDNRPDADPEKGSSQTRKRWNR